MPKIRSARPSPLTSPIATVTPPVYATGNGKPEPSSVCVAHINQAREAAARARAEQDVLVSIAIDVAGGDEHATGEARTKRRARPKRRPMGSVEGSDLATAAGHAGDDASDAVPVHIPGRDAHAAGEAAAKRREADHRCPSGLEDTDEPAARAGSDENLRIGRQRRGRGLGVHAHAIGKVSRPTVSPRVRRGSGSMASLARVRPNGGETIRRTIGRAWAQQQAESDRYAAEVGSVLASLHRRGGLKARLCR